MTSAGPSLGSRGRAGASPDLVEMVSLPGDRSLKSWLLRNECRVLSLAWSSLAVFGVSEGWCDMVEISRSRPLDSRCLLEHVRVDLRAHESDAVVWQPRGALVRNHGVEVG